MRTTKTSIAVFVIAATLGLFLFFRLGIFSRLGDAASRIAVMPSLRMAHWFFENVFSLAGGGLGKDSDGASLVSRDLEIASLRRENEQLREAAGFSRVIGRKVVPASAAGFFRSAGNEVLLIDQGSEAGIAAGNLVFSNGKIYVGRVVAAGKGRSEVLLPTSEMELMEVLFPAAGVRARAKGSSGGEVIIDFVPMDSAVGVGDIFEIAPGSEGGASGMFLGEVREAKDIPSSVFKSIRAIPLFYPLRPGEIFVAIGV